jgi:two-component system, NarL family, nitrate/nitrite response regulator NarL
MVTGTVMQSTHNTTLPAASAIETRIIIVDPHPLVREGLRASLERRPSIEVVAEAGDGMAGLYAAARFPGAILMTNANLPDTSTVELVRRYQAEAGKGSGVVICHMPENPALIRQLFDNCARAYIGQNASSREYAAAIDAVRAGGVFISTNLVGCLLERDGGSRGKANPYKLTDREVEILACLASGYSNKEVANKFDLSVRTVEAHRLSIRQKTGANVLSELVRIARSLESEGLQTTVPVLQEITRPFLRDDSAAPSAGFMVERRDA